MAVRKKRKVQRPHIQFSKKLVAAVMIFWCIVRLFSVVAAFLNPESAVGMARIVEGIDQIAMINTFSYAGNSISEKISLGYFKYKQSVATVDKEQEEETETSSNG